MFIRFNVFLTVIFLATFLIIKLFVSDWVFAQTDNDSKAEVSDSNVLRYRRWLAPFDKINDWPFNGERYVPMRRDLFEGLINSHTVTPKESAKSQKNKFSRIVMNAQLKGNQLANGKGYFEIIQDKLNSPQTPNTNTNPQNIHPDRIINLEPWSQWINITQPQTNPNTPNNIQQNTQLICTSDGKTLLILPDQNNLRNENTNKPENGNEKLNHYLTQFIYFDWSLRGKVDPQGRLQFDVTFPRSLGTEFNIELPADKILTCSSGVVIEGEANGQNRESRNWKILTGTVNNVTITVSNKNNPQSKQSNTAYSQSILYNISTSGLEVTATFSFDRNDPAVDSFEIELDSPLVSVAVHSGEAAILSSFIEQIERENHTLLRIDLSGVAAARRHEVTLVALAPIVTGNSRADVIIEDNIWKLPRVRAVSKNLFWKETRCSLIVQRPLQTRNLSFINSMQVRSTTDMTRSPHDTFELKYFNQDAQVGVNIYQEESRISIESFIQIYLNDDSIGGNMTAAIRVTEGRRFTFTFPISPNWAIHSVRSIAGEEILSWDIVQAKDLKIELDRNLRNDNIESFLAIQLKKPLGVGDLVRIQMVGRFLTDPHREFKLSEFSPILLLLPKNESHFIAIQTESSSQLQYRLKNSVLFEIRDLNDAKLQQLFFDQPEGILLPLDVRTHDIAFKTGRTRPDYAADITGKINIGMYNSTASFNFNIKPRDMAIERIYVYFIETKNTTEKSIENSHPITQHNSQLWHWDISSESTLQENYRTKIPHITPRIIKGRELDEFTAAIANRKFQDNFKKGELWEIRFSPPQNNPFEISATRPLTATDEIIIPFAVLPAALSQHGEIYIESDGQFPYAIVCNNLKSIPTDISNRYLSRYTRAAFGFDPIDEMKQRNEPTLKLQRIDITNTPPEAWIWLMKLESQYGIDGVVKNCANFHIESRGKESLQITLPSGITVDDIGVVWLDNKQTTWRSSSPQTLTVFIPPSERYVTVSVEYSYKNSNQQTVTEITPKYPETDIPVLSKNCIAWFHPDYKIINSSGIFNASRFFKSDISNASAYLFRQNKNQHKAMPALQSFNELILQTTEKNSELTWKILAEDEKRFAELLLQNIRATLGNESYNTPTVRFYVDMLGLARCGIMPNSVIATGKNLSEISVCNGLTIFISITTTVDGQDEYSFYFTSFLTAGIFQHFNGKQIGDRVWFVDNDNLAKFILADVEETAGKIYESMPSTTVGKPQMLNVADWIRTVQKTEDILWSDTNHSFRQGNISPDWKAYEIKDDGGKTYFIVRSNLVKTYYLAAFLVVVVLTCRRPLASPILLILIMITSQTLQFFLSPVYTAITAGIFAGAGISLVFALIRSYLFVQQNKNATPDKPSQTEPNQQEENITEYLNRSHSSF
ncbi:MAG: hypothetical protein LBC74_09285 [Planctomycetaceae bacterium]|jgi:hypothetical protein|nr:hypothetical protein [Planctomycetaceae bacterium]